MGTRDRIPDRDRAAVHRHPSGVHPAVGRARRLHARGDPGRPPRAGRHRVDGPRPVPPDQIADPRTRREHRPGGPGRAVRGQRPGTGQGRHPAAGRGPRRVAGRLRGLLRRTAAGRPAGRQRSGTVHGRRRGPLLVPHLRTEPVPDPHRRPGRRTAARHGPAPLPPRPHPLHRLGRGPRPGHHAHLRRGQRLPRIRRGVRGQEEPGPGLHGDRRPVPGKEFGVSNPFRHARFDLVLEPE